MVWLGTMNDYSSVTAKHDWISTNKTNSLSDTDTKKKSPNFSTNLLDLHSPIQMKERPDSSCCSGYKPRNVAFLIREALKLSAPLLRKRFMANLC